MEKILFVDDDPNLLAAIRRQLRKTFTIDTRLGPEEGLKAADNGETYAVIVADMRMPGMDGIQFLSQVKEKSPDSVRMMLTGNADQKTAIDAVNQGRIFRFLTKPCPPEVMSTALEAGISQYRLIIAERELLEETLNGSMKMLTDILSMVEPRSFGRVQKLRERIRKLAKALNFERIWELELAAMLSQIGILTVPPDILVRSRVGDPLTGVEKDMLARVPEIGRRLLMNIPRLDSVAAMIYYQNKHFDGSGFPVDSVSGEKIPLGARMLKVIADLNDLDRDGNRLIHALEELGKRGGYYDPKILKATCDCFAPRMGEETDSNRDTVAISSKDLGWGQELAADIETTHGVLVLPAGNKIYRSNLERLRNLARLEVLQEPILIVRDSRQAGTKAGEVEWKRYGSRHKAAPSAPVMVMKQKGESPIQPKRALG